MIMTKKPIIPQIFQDFHYLMNDDVITWEIYEEEVMRYPIHIIPMLMRKIDGIPNSDLTYEEFTLNLN